MVILIQSFAVGVFNTLLNRVFGSGDSGGTTGIVVAVLLFLAGIVSLVVRRRETKKAYIPLIVLLELATMIGFVGAGNNAGLVVWAIWCFICFIVAVFGLVKVLKPGIVLKKQCWFWTSIVGAIVISAIAIAVPRGDSNMFEKVEEALKKEMAPKQISSKTIR